jgi:hypothetical protein
MKSPFVWLAVFVVFCFASWLAVENSLNAEFRTTYAEQAKQIESLTKEVADTKAKADMFGKNLISLLPDKVEIIRAAHLAQFGEAVPPSAPAKK